MEKKLCNIGTIGHVDHGKTTLSAAISYVLSINLDNFDKNFQVDQIDKTPEERARGITIKNTQIDYHSANRYYAHVDCPGHQHYVKNMITGTSVMDGTILVVSGIDGPQEQTREHILLAREIGVKSLLVFVNKMDNAILDKDIVDVVELEVRDLLTTYNYDGDNIPVIYGSARVALEATDFSSCIGFKSIQQLMEVVDYFVEQPKRLVDLPFLMPIESIYSISGRGTVLAGKAEKGTLKVGADVEIIGYGETKKTTCTGLEMFKTNLTTAEAGVSLAVLVRGIKKDEVRRGQVVIEPGSYTQHDKFIARISVSSKEDGGRPKPFFSGYRPQFFFRTADITGTITLPEDCLIANPGDTIEASVELFKPICLETDLRFAIREGRMTVGAGTVKTIL